MSPGLILGWIALVWLAGLTVWTRDIDRRRKAAYRHFDSLIDRLKWDVGSLEHETQEPRGHVQDPNEITARVQTLENRSARIGKALMNQSSEAEALLEEMEAES